MRITHALNDFQEHVTVLHSIHNSLVATEYDAPNLDPSPAKLNSTQHTKRDVSDYFGLASAGDLAELNHYVTQLQTSETDLVHSSSMQLSYLNRTVRRLNLQEKRINQLASVEIGWDRTLSVLQRNISDLPTYLSIIITLIRGYSVIQFYHNNVRTRLMDDITTLRMLEERHLPASLLSRH